MKIFYLYEGVGARRRGKGALSVAPLPSTEPQGAPLAGQSSFLRAEKNRAGRRAERTLRSKGGRNSRKEKPGQVRRCLLKRELGRKRGRERERSKSSDPSKRRKGIALSCGWMGPKKKELSRDFSRGRSRKLKGSSGKPTRRGKCSPGGEAEKKGLFGGGVGVGPSRRRTFFAKTRGRKELGEASQRLTMSRKLRRRVMGFRREVILQKRESHMAHPGRGSRGRESLVNEKKDPLPPPIPR